MNHRYLIASLCVLLLVPMELSAHALGVSHETIVDGIGIDIGYSSPAPQVGESVIFDFNLPATESKVAYSDVWIRIESAEGNVVLATAIHRSAFGGPRMSYVFPKEGNYMVHVRYEQEAAAVVKTAFPLTVVSATQSSILVDMPWYAWLVIGMSTGASALYGTLASGFLKIRPRNRLLAMLLKDGHDRR